MNDINSSDTKDYKAANIKKVAEQQGKVSTIDNPDLLRATEFASGGLYDGKTDDAEVGDFYEDKLYDEFYNADEVNYDEDYDDDDDDEDYDAEDYDDDDEDFDDDYDDDDEDEDDDEDDDEDEDEDELYKGVTDNAKVDSSCDYRMITKSDDTVTTQGS